MRRVATGSGFPIVFATAREIDGLRAPSNDKAAARADLARAESRGFRYCEAVFIERGALLSYDGLSEKAHPTNGSLNWGRGQNVVGRHFFRDGKLVPDPDYVSDDTQPEAEWEHNGLRCYVWYVKAAGHRCGYVEVPVGHPWHGKDYNQCTRSPACEDTYCEHSISSLVEVHGGVTWADENWRGEWCLGFDCAHSGDRPDPAFTRARIERYGYDSFYERAGRYWTADDVKHETNRMAEQVAAAATVALIAAPEA